MKKNVNKLAEILQKRKFMKRTAEVYLPMDIDHKRNQGHKSKNREI